MQIQPTISAGAAAGSVSKSTSKDRASGSSAADAAGQPSQLWLNKSRAANNPAPIAMLKALGHRSASRRTITRRLAAKCLNHLP